MAFINYEGDEIPTREPDFTRNGISYWFEELFIENLHPWYPYGNAACKTLKFNSLKDMFSFVPPIDLRSVKQAHKNWKDNQLFDNMLFGNETFFERVIRRVKNIW